MQYLKEHRRKESYIIAKEFFTDNWKDKKATIHNEIIIEICLNSISETNLNKDILIIAGWLHNLGKSDGKEDYGKSSKEYMDYFLNKNPQFNIYRKEIKDAIYTNAENSPARTPYGDILRTANKILTHHKDWINIVTS